MVKGGTRAIEDAMRGLNLHGATRPGEMTAKVKIYTKTGDDGTTGLLGPGRFAKDDIRIEAYGTVDELNAVLGLARAQGIDEKLNPVLGKLQDELFVVGSALADPNPNGKFFHAIKAEQVVRLEGLIDSHEAEIGPLASFILPGGCPQAAWLHLARTVCRRAERLVVHLTKQPEGHVAPDLLIYLNRLSDLLFVLARVANHRAGVADVPWKGL